MVDALAPAVRAYQHALAAGAGIAEAAQAAAAAAEKGAEATIPLQALKGRASYLGARSVGHQDPGATSTALLLHAPAPRPWAGPGHDHHVPRGPLLPRGGPRPGVAAAGCGARTSGSRFHPRRRTRSGAPSRRPRPGSTTSQPRSARDGAVEYADILEAEALIARDPAFADEVVALLDEPSTDATSAVTQVAERHAAVMAGLASADLRERAADIRQVGRMVSDRLGGRVPPAPPAGPFVLLAHEVTAPDLLEYAEQVTGAVSVLGGAGSHASIVARSLGVPLVVGVDPAALDAATGITRRRRRRPRCRRRRPGRRHGGAAAHPHESAVGSRAGRISSPAGPHHRRRGHHAAGQRRLQHRGPPGARGRRRRRRAAADRAAVPGGDRLADPRAARGRPAPGARGAARPTGHRAAARLHPRQGPAVPARPAPGGTSSLALLLEHPEALDAQLRRDPGDRPRARTCG